MAREEQILVTVIEAKMARKLLEKIETKRKSYGIEKAWLYRSEAIVELKGFKSSTIRSFLEKLEKKGVIENIPPSPWGGVFRFTINGEEKIRRELADLNVGSPRADADQVLA